jgi:hypothetical protein
LQEFLEKADKGKEGGAGGADRGISDALNEVRCVISCLLAVPIYHLESVLICAGIVYFSAFSLTRTGFSMTCTSKLQST